MGNLVTAKSLSDVKLSGLRFEWQKHDGQVKTVTLTDEHGNVAIIKCAATYTDTLTVMVPEPPKKAQRWIVSGTFAGIAIRKAFETSQEARAARDEFPSTADLTVEMAEVTVDDEGSEIDAPPEEIPF